jgi:AraC-like DNA-binding protein
MPTRHLAALLLTIQSGAEGHRSKCQTATVSPAKPGDYPFYLIKRFVLRICETINHLAGASALKDVEASHLNSGVSVNYPITPLAFLTELRLGLARQKLMAGTATLAAIAAEVGYQSESALSRAFQRRFGVRPGEARRSWAVA